MPASEFAIGEEVADRACDRCRERRVKCDKRQPTCRRCEKLGKPCPGYDKKRKFVDEGATLRRKFQAIDADAGSREQRFVAGLNSPPNPTISDFVSAVTLPPRPAVPKVWPGQDDVIMATEPVIVNQNAFIDSPSVAAYASHSGTDISVEDVFDLSKFDPSWFNVDPADFYGKNNNSCGFIPNLPSIVDEVDKNDFSSFAKPDAAISGVNGDSDTIDDLDRRLTPKSKSTWASESQFSTSALITDEREHEMAYLIRHFTEAIGPWMDLFDRDKHFAQMAPLKALRDRLLRNAIAAVAAKQLGRTQGSKPFLGLQNQKPATMEILQDETGVDWFYKAANYYDKAIAFSRAYLQILSSTLSESPSASTQMSLTKVRSDDLLVAVSIFSLYESLDNGELGWQQHLAGLKSLFSALSADITVQKSIAPSITVGCKAAFWNFARADYQASYLKRQRTLLDPDDLVLWRSCGLQVDDGSLYRDLSAATNEGQTLSMVKNEALGGHEAAELVSYTLLWIVVRLVNYLAGENDTVAAARQTQWAQITQQLDAWHQSLPDTFQPCAQIKHLVRSKSSKKVPTQLKEMFFSIDVCAAAMQLYHFARILLLLNQPSHNPVESMSRSETGHTGAASRLRAYREISNEATEHAHQIISIALGRPHPAVRVEMLLPLSVAGSCLDDEDERDVVVELLRAIEKDTGRSTEAIVEELVREWQR